MNTRSILYAHIVTKSKMIPEREICWHLKLILAVIEFVSNNSLTVKTIKIQNT